MAVNTAQSMDVINRSFKDSLTCSICQDILRVPVYTVNQCQHVYCETCIREAKLHGDTCPNCREPIQSLMRSTFIENILDIFYQMNPDIQRREPCERWVEPPPRSPSRESDIVILNIGDNPDAPILHMVQFASYYQRALNALYEPLNEVDTDVGSRRSRRLRGLPPEEVTETVDADDEEDDEVFDTAVGPDRSGMNIAPSEDDGEAEGDDSWIQEVPENRTVATRPPPSRRGRKRPRTDQEQSDGPEQPDRPEPETSAAGNMTSSDVESRNCVIRRAQR